MDHDPCDGWQTAISARADGEDTGVHDHLLDAHLEGCPSCRAFAAAIEGSRRRLVMQEAPVMPDLSHRVSKLTAIADRASKWGVVRALLLVVAAEVIVLSAPSLFDGDNHEVRHLGAFSVAYGVALAVVAVRPARARTVLPVSFVLAAALSITAVIDLARGVVPLTDEATHIPELISVLLVWLLTVPRPGRDRRAATDDRAAATPALRVVRDDGDAGRRAV